MAFISIAYAQSLVISLVVGLTGGPRSRWVGLGYLAMLIPALSVLFANEVAGDHSKPIGWDRFPLRYLPIALFLMPLVLHAAMLPTVAVMGRLRWQDWLTSSDGRLHSPQALG